MKDQYFGDFGDYQKFSLLKVLRDVGGFNITVHWMKTKNDGRPDGNKVVYLKDAERWESYDKNIFTFIKNHIDRNVRELALYESSEHSLGIHFVNDHIEVLSQRQKLLQNIEQNNQSDLIFFDPDNGIEVISMTAKNLHKYVRWEELEVAYNSGKNVLVYQHYSRMNRDVFIEAKLTEIKERIQADVFVIKAKHSVYFLMLHKTYETKGKKALAEYAAIWGGLIAIRN